jgi:glycosyltransferase involved in cell wall biosynthesis
MNISVVIPTFKRQPSLFRLLTSIAQQDFPKDNFEVIVVDDQSGESLDTIINEFKKSFSVRWLVSKKKGRPGARNTGAAEAMGELLVFLDDDMETGTDLSNAYHQGTVTHPNCVLCGAIKSNSVSPTLWNTLIDQRFELRNKYLLKNPNDVPFTGVFTGNIAIPAKTFQNVGGFDENTFSFYGGEDFDFGLRCIKNEIQIVYCCDAIATHNEKTYSTSLYLRNLKVTSYSMILIIQKHKSFVMQQPEMKHFDVFLPGLFTPEKGFFLNRCIKQFFWFTRLHIPLFYLVSKLWGIIPNGLSITLGSILIRIEQLFQMNKAVKKIWNYNLNPRSIYLSN